MKSLLLVHKRELCIVFLLICTGLTSIAQNPVIEKITTRNGLSQNNVYCMLQDRYGYMWFGTDDGLNRYNGYEFKVYGIRFDGETGLNSNLIMTLETDPEKNIWIGTAENGVNIYDPKTDTFSEFVPDSNQPNHLKDERILDIDFLTNGDVLILTPTRLYVYANHGDSYVLRKFNGKDFLEIFDGVFKFLHVRDENRIFIGSIKGLYVYEFDANSFSFDFHPAFRKGSFKCIMNLDSGILILADKGIYYQDHSEKIVHLSGGNYDYALVDKEKKLWVSSDEGIHRFNIHLSDSIYLDNYQLYTVDENNQPFLHQEILVMMEDNTGVLWAGTRSGGLIKINKKAKNFIHIKDDFSGYRVNSIYQDSKENIWVGTAGGGAFLSRKAEQPTFSFEPIDLGLVGTKRIQTFHEMEMNGQEYVLSGTHFRVNHLKHQIRSDGLVESSKISSALDSAVYPVYAFESVTQQLWLGTYGGGLMRYDCRTDTLVTFTPDNSNLPSIIVRSLLFDSRDRLWVGTDKGLCLLESTEYDSESPEFKVFTQNKEVAGSLSHNYILPIVETVNHEIWVGTLGGGLNGYDEQSQKFHQITTINGLSNNNIKGIVEDAKGHLWVSSNKGISEINLKTGSITNYDLSDGLQDYEFSDMAICKLSNGSLLFGGVNGINIIDPSKVEKDLIDPKLVFGDLHVLNEQISPGETLNGRLIIEKNLNELDQLSLKYHENSFVIGFTALLFTSPKKIQYEYKLEGFDDHWIKTDWNARYAKYTSLLPGDYLFKVRLAGNDDFENQQLISLPIEVIPPIWMSKMGIVLYVLIIGMIIFFITKYSLIRRNLKNALFIEHLERDKIKELTQLKLRFFTNISHEFRTPLAIIIGYLDQLSTDWQTKDEASVKRQFSIINRNANLLMRLINQLIDFRKYEQGKMSLEASSADIVAFVRDVCPSFQILADNKKIEWSFSTDRSEIWLNFDADKMEKILNNILSNAFKYTRQGGRVGIEIHDGEDDVTIVVSDSGVGIPKDKQAHIFDRFYVAGSSNNSSMGSSGIGLSFTKSLIEMHQGSIEVASELNVGTTFKLKFRKDLAVSSNTSIDSKETSSPNLFISTAEREEVHALYDESTTTIATVLVAEDNEDLLNYLTENLLQSGYRVYQAKHGEDALEICIKNEPDIVISDVMMPGMDGIALCQHMKTDERISHIPVILLTAKTAIETEIQGFNVGADAYVSKPFNMEALKAQMNSITRSRAIIWSRFKENPLFVPTEFRFNNADQHFLTKVSQIVNDNLSDPSFSVERLSSNFKMSHTTFFNKLKSIVGLTPNQYIRSIRMKRAAELLMEDDFNITEIIYKVGFSDLSYFREQFKNTFNLTPRDYRKSKSKEIKIPD